MKRVFTGINLADTTHLKNLLEQAGIGSFIKNAYLGSAVGELPVFDVSPEIWVFCRASALVLADTAPSRSEPQSCAFNRPRT